MYISKQKQVTRMRIIMKKFFTILLSSLLLSVMISRESFAQTVYNLNPDSVIHTLDERIYGQFLEHIYNSVNGGLWGETVWNRSFERTGATSGLWKIEDSIVIQSSLSENVRLLIGDTDWQDYELSLQARKVDGAEGFLVMFRANGDDFYWFNAGGWGNTLHAIEKGIAGQGRWGVLDGLEQAGSIDLDLWYNIRIRCEGNHFQVWLNENPVFDFTDAAAHLSGQVGLGTWLTRADFKNILVTEIPSGDTLFIGLPDVEPAIETSFPNWESAGTAGLYLDQDALNSDVCVKIVNKTATEGGLEQGSVNLKKQLYEGSFWVKGSTTGDLKVKLFAGPAMVAEAIFPPPGNDWQEYSFSLDPVLSSVNGKIQVLMTDTGTIYVDQVSMMGQDAIDNNGFRPDLYAAVDSLRPPVIRWPGGYYAELYRWKDGIGPQHERGSYPIESWNDRDPNSFGTDEFMTMCDQLGSEPLIVINIGHRYYVTPREEYIREAQDWVEYCNGDTTTTWGKVRKENGHPEPYNVKLWEISNEIWLTRDVNTYINYIKAFVPALKEIDPDIRIIACGSGGFDQGWNQTLISQCAGLIDFVSTHHYEDIANYRTGVDQYNNFLSDLAVIIKNSSNPDIKIYMSEWNVWSPIDWRCGLYAGGMLNTFEKQGEYFKIGGPALFLRHQNAGDAWNNAFINFDNSRWFPAPNYVVMKLWRDHYAPNFIEMEGTDTRLNVVSTMSADTSMIYFKAVNSSENSIQVNLSIEGSFIPDTAILEEIYASLYEQNSISDPDYIEVQTGVATISGNMVSFNLKANSASVVSISRQEKPTGVFPTLKESARPGFMIQPNPCAISTTIRYHLEQEGMVSIRILDLSGKVVRLLVNEALPAGEGQLRWDGTDENGNRLSNGTYICEVKSVAGTRAQKILLVN